MIMPASHIRVAGFFASTRRNTGAVSPSIFLRLQVAPRHLSILKKQHPRRGCCPVNIILRHDVVAGVYVEHFTGDAACEVAEQEGYRIADFELIDVALEWCTLFDFLEDGLEVSDC